MWEKMSFITKNDRIIFTDVIRTVRHICHVVDSFSEVLKYFHDYFLLNMSDQLVVEIVFSCFWLKNYKNLVLRYSMTIKLYFCVELSLK